SGNSPPFVFLRSRFRNRHSPTIAGGKLDHSPLDGAVRSAEHARRDRVRGEVVSARFPRGSNADLYWRAADSSRRPKSDVEGIAGKAQAIALVCSGQSDPPIIVALATTSADLVSLLQA